MPDFVINRKAPIIMGVEVLDGQLKMGTPICVPSKEVSFTPPTTMPVQQTFSCATYHQMRIDR
eukprot:COSAG03_NODE_9169_length_741_cov_0.964174_2_plen_62_part_01